MLLVSWLLLLRGRHGGPSSQHPWHEFYPECSFYMAPLWSPTPVQRLDHFNWYGHFILDWLAGSVFLPIPLLCCVYSWLWSPHPIFPTQFGQFPSTGHYATSMTYGTPEKCDTVASFQTGAHTGRSITLGEKCFFSHKLVHRCLVTEREETVCHYSPPLSMNSFCSPGFWPRLAVVSSGYELTIVWQKRACFSVVPHRSPVWFVFICF